MVQEEHGKFLGICKFHSISRGEDNDRYCKLRKLEMEELELQYIMNATYKWRSRNYNATQNQYLNCWPNCGIQSNY